MFTGNPLNRGEVERRDEDWINKKAKDSTTKFLAMRNLNPLIFTEPEPQLGWISLENLEEAGAEVEPIFLGLVGQTAHFVVDVTAMETKADQFQDRAGYAFEDARSAAERISMSESGMLAQARAQLDWHKRHAFCSVCGSPSEKRRGGQARQCPQCNAQHFPRTDPVVIVLVTDGERCLLGQSRGRLSRMKTYSALAGFMDQGEVIEEAVAREVMEEAGIQVGKVTYHSSQPWPFPSSLMIGCHAEAATTEINFEPEEMADVQWFSREEVLLALDRKSEVLNVPGPIAIAHHLIKSWARKEL